MRNDFLLLRRFFMVFDALTREQTVSDSTAKVVQPTKTPPFLLRPSQETFSTLLRTRHVLEL